MKPRPDATAAPAGSRSGLVWASGAFAAGVALNLEHLPPWVSAAALVLIAWRLTAAWRPIGLPGTVVRTLVALLLVAGVVAQFRTLNGLAAGTALLTLMGPVKLLETRVQRDQFIVLGAALFLLLAACLDRQDLVRAPLYVTHVWLCCTALAIVAYGPAPHSPFGSREAIALAGRNLLLALPLAVLLFVFFPRIPGAFWAIPRTSDAVTGLGDSMSPGSITNLSNSYDVAFRARFDGALPPPQERYWRGPVLHDFDGFTWSRTPTSFARHDALQYLGSAYRYRISLEPSSQRWWISLDTAVAAPEPKVFFTYDYQLISAEPVVEPTSYALVSYTSTRATTDISALARRHDTTLPAVRNPRSRQLALQLRHGAASDRTYVDAVLRHFKTGGFTYSVTPPALGPDSVDDFLFGSRVGFCGHYASAFVALMRAGGVPARIVTGYLGGEWNPVGGYFIVHQSDAHAWAEVWLDGRGWTRVDPTAVVEPARLTRGIIDLLPNAVSASARFVWSKPWLTALVQRWDALNAWWNDRVLKFNYDDQLHLLERLGLHSPGAGELGWAFAGGLIIWLGWIAWRFGRLSLRRADRLSRAYTRLGRKLAQAGIARQAHEGPLRFAAEISRARPDLADVRALVVRYAQLRYGPPAGEAQEIEFERAVASVRIAAVS